MAVKRRPSFDPKSFLARVGEGRSIDRFGKDQIVFSQGDPADAVFYIQKADVLTGTPATQTRKKSNAGK